jgi:hypothetical protein
MTYDHTLILSGLRLIHFAGIIFGVGAATLLDLIIARFIIMKAITIDQIRIIKFSSNIITWGLIFLWLSGLGFLVYYWFFDIAKIFNPKLVAKVIIVGVLTVNAFLVHYFVLPNISEQIGMRMLQGLGQLHATVLLAIGSISAISWYVPLILGIVPQLNNVVPAELILANYAILVVSVNVIIQIVLVFYLYGTDRDHRQ